MKSHSNTIRNETVCGFQLRKIRHTSCSEHDTVAHTMVLICLETREKFEGSLGVEGTCIHKRQDNDSHTGTVVVAGEPLV